MIDVINDWLISAGYKSHMDHRVNAVITNGSCVYIYDDYVILSVFLIDEAYKIDFSSPTFFDELDYYIQLADGRL